MHLSAPPGWIRLPQKLCNRGEVSYLPSPSGRKPRCFGFWGSFLGARFPGYGLKSSESESEVVGLDGVFFEKQSHTRPMAYTSAAWKAGTSVEQFENACTFFIF
jgi:hypothetical protein